MVTPTRPLAFKALPRHSAPARDKNWTKRLITSLTPRTGSQAAMDGMTTRPYCFWSACNHRNMHRPSFLGAHGLELNTNRLHVETVQDMRRPLRQPWHET